MYNVFSKSKINVYHDIADSMRGFFRGNDSTGKQEAKKEIDARQLRIEVANNWTKKLREFEKKDYPAPIAKVMAKTVSAALRWTEPFKNEDKGFMEVAAGNIAGKNGEKVVTGYNNIEASIASKNSVLAEVIKKKNKIITQEGVAMVHDGRRIKEEIKAIPGEIKTGLGQLIPKFDIVIDPEVSEKKKSAEANVALRQGQLITTVNKLEEAVRHTDNTQKEAEKKGQEAITATKEANQIIEAAISGQGISTKPKDTIKTVYEKPDPIESQKMRATPGLRGKLENIRNLTQDERVSSLTSERDSYLKNQLVHPDENQQKMISDFVTEKKVILPTLIIDEEFNKKLADGTLDAADILKQPVLLDLFLRERGDAFYGSLTDAEKNDVKIIDELLGAARLADERRQEAEQSARDLSEAIRNKNQAETDYFGAAEQAKNAQSRLNQAEEEVKKAIDITQLNNKVVEANPTEENISAYARSRRERFNDRLEVEIGGDISTRIQKEKNGTYIIVSKDSGSKIDLSGWSDFPTRKEARRAQMRYELFSQKPLDVFLSQKPEYIDKIKNDPIIQNLWRQMNPSEPMKLMDFRRLLMVAMMKNMNPEKYGHLTYREIRQRAGGSVMDEFISTYQKSRGSLGLQNAGIEDIRKIMNIVVDPDTWKAKPQSKKPIGSI